jgi:hypothetical protein
MARAKCPSCQLLIKNGLLFSKTAPLSELHSAVNPVFAQQTSSSAMQTATAAGSGAADNLSMMMLSNVMTANNF